MFNLTYLLKMAIASFPNLLWLMPIRFSFCLTYCITRTKFSILSKYRIIFVGEILYLEKIENFVLVIQYVKQNEKLIGITFFVLDKTTLNKNIAAPPFLWSDLYNRRMCECICLFTCYKMYYIHMPPLWCG